MFQATHRYVGIGTIHGISPGAQVVIVEPGVEYVTVECANGSRWITRTEYVVPLWVAHA